MDTDYEEVVEIISKPVWCILKSVSIRVIRGSISVFGFNPRMNEGA
jgi:hypothetical protein